MKTIGVLTSGGDSPGMNACIRAVVRQGDSRGLHVIGIRRGYEGLIDGLYIPMTSRTVSSIMRMGGTALQTARSERFLDGRVRMEAVERLREEGIDGLIVIGGNGSLRGGVELANLGMPVIGIPASIDNDMGGTEMAIGVDTCLNTILDAIDKIKDTAGSLRRPFIIEVMGRECGYLALLSGLAGGAEMVVIPEHHTTLEEIVSEAQSAFDRGKPMFIVMVSEGSDLSAAAICDYMNQHQLKDSGRARLTVLGHVQRGGSPSAFDRILATRMGVAAVDSLVDGHHRHMVGLSGGAIRPIPLDDALVMPLTVEADLSDIAQVLAR